MVVCFAEFLSLMIVGHQCFTRWYANVFRSCDGIFNFDSC